MNSEFTITRIFNAPQDLMFKLWSDPNHLDKWFGPSGSRITQSKMEARPGGFYHYRLEMPDGMEVWGRFQYQELSPNDRLIWIASFSDENGGITRHPMAPDWPAEMMTIVTFQPENEGKTRVTVSTIPHNSSQLETDTFIKAMDSLDKGWGGTLDRLEEYIIRLD
ncbi:MAG: SRPBCC domain-containing protein [Fimbriimonadaceae bacterium]|nr:SRPBCC domain-containing protein [Fimbriimonadaceae bacterium]